MTSVVVDFVVVVVEITTSSSTVVAAIEVPVPATCICTLVCTCYESSVCLPGKGILLILCALADCLKDVFPFWVYIQEEL